MDINKVATLLHILEKSSQSTTLRSIAGLAHADLVEINGEAEEELAERAKKAAEEATAAKAKAAEEAKAAEKISYEPPPTQGEGGNGEMTRRSF